MMKIRIIELLNKIVNKEKLPKKIKWGTVNYILKQDSCDEHFYYEKEQGLASLVSELKTMNDLKSEVEILEDNTEKQEYLGESWKEVGKRVGEWAKEFEQGFKESFTEIVTCPFKKLEDNTEDIEEIKIRIKGQDACISKINELVRAVNKLKSEQN